MNQVSIIIVNWNSGNFLAECLESIKRFGGGSEVIVIDNASSDNSLKKIKSAKKLKIIKNKKNVGFGKACNQGAKLATGKYLFFLNPDCRLTKNSVQPMFERINSLPKIGGVGPILLDSDTLEKQRGYYLKFPGFFQILFFYTKLEAFFNKSVFFKKIILEENLNGEIDQIPGAALMINKEIFHSFNGFDEGLFLWFEDVDLCFRLKKMGFKILVAKESVILHKGGGSFQSWNDLKQKREIRQRSLKYFLKKNYSPISFNIFSLILQLDPLLAWVKRGVK